jgi:dephospho-CoA kinase
LLKLAIRNARQAALAKGDQGKVALSFGPMGALIEPLGPVSKEEVIEEYSNLTRIAASEPGFDLYILETFSNLDELESAIEGGAPYVLVAVPLLVESRDWRGRYQRVLVIDCPPEIQIERVMRRSGLERAQVEAIMSAQASRDQRLAAADDVIDNSGEPGALTSQVARLDSLYRGLSTKGE